MKIFKCSLPAICLASVMGCLPGSGLAQGIQPNSEQFNVSKFFYVDASGDIARMRVVGFAEPQVSGVKRRVLFLPNIDIKKGGVGFIGKNGATIQDPDQATESSVARVRVAMTYDGQLADPRQRLAALSQLYPAGESMALPDVHQYDPAAPNGSFLDSQIFYYKALLDTRKSERVALRAKQDAQAARWGELSPSVAAINNVRFTLLIDGDVVSSRVTSGTLVAGAGVLPDLFFTDITEYQINRIKEGGFQIGIEYGFIDSNTKSIEANFDMSRIMQQVVSESRQLTAASKKSGVQILGFGKRKSILTQAIKEESRESVKQDNRAGTVVQMRDADESMLEMFEAKFFPQLAKAQVVENHLKAAEVAKSQGADALAKAHLGYAKAVQDEKLDLDVDTAGAMASLSAGDYAGFIAKGVKMQKFEGSTATNFARVLTKDVEETGSVSWTLVKTVSTQRVVSMVIDSQYEARAASLGVCDLVQHQIPTPSGKSMVPVIIPTCLVKNGALDRAGFRPGDVIGRLSGLIVKTRDELEAVLSNYKPGETMNIENLILTPTGWQSKIVPVKLRSGLPKEG